VKLCCYRALYTYWISKCCADRDPERFVVRPGAPGEQAVGTLIVIKSVHLCRCCL